MLKHNKKKNSQIIFEQLMILATRLALNSKKKQAKEVLRIVKEHYKPGTELGREKKLFDAITSNSAKTVEEAEAILVEVLNEVKFIKEKPLDREKVILVNKIIDTIGKELFSIPVKEYKLLASTQILFNETRNNFKHSNPGERVKIKKILIENLNKKPAVDEIGEVDNLTNKIVIKKFNEKYSSIMNEDQKEVFSGWMDFLFEQEEDKIISLLENKRQNAKITLQILSENKKHDSSEYKMMLEESISKLSEPIKNVDENLVYETMRYFDLIEDLEESIQNEVQ